MGKLLYREKTVMTPVGVESKGKEIDAEVNPNRGSLYFVSDQGQVSLWYFYSPIVSDTRFFFSFGY